MTRNGILFALGYSVFATVASFVILSALGVGSGRGDPATPTPLVCPTVGPVPGSCDDLRLRCLTTGGENLAPCQLLLLTCK